MAERISPSENEVSFLPRKWVGSKKFQLHPRFEIAVKESLKKSSGNPVYRPDGKKGIIRLKDANCKDKDFVMVYPRVTPDKWEREEKDSKPRPKSHKPPHLRPFPAQILYQVVKPSLIVEYPHVSYIARTIEGGVRYISLGGGTTVQRLETRTP